MRTRNYEKLSSFVRRGPYSNTFSKFQVKFNVWFITYWPARPRMPRNLWRDISQTCCEHFAMN